MTSQKLKEQFTRPLVVGAASGIAARLMDQDFEVELPLIKMNVSGPIFYALLGVGSSLLTETIHQWVLPYLPQSSAYVKAENAILSPAIHGGLNVLALKLCYPAIINQRGTGTSLIIGASAEVVGDYAYENFVKSMIK